MPRSNGVYTPPSGTAAVSGQPIDPDAFNALIQDISTALTYSIAADGETTITANIPMAGHKFTGMMNGTDPQDSATMAQILPAAWKTVASASSIDLGASSQRRFIITGTTSITSLGTTGTSDGIPIDLYFKDGGLQIVPSANLLTPGYMTGTGTLASGTTSMTSVSNVANLAVGMYVWGTGIPANTTVVGIIGTTVTLSANATASGSVTYSAAPLVTVNKGDEWIAVSAGAGNPWTVYSGLSNPWSLSIAGPLYLSGDPTQNLGAATKQYVDKETISNLIGIAATVASNNLTIAMTPAWLDFRSATANDGTVTRRLCAPSNLVVPSGATLGTQNGVAATLAVLVCDNGGTEYLAVINLGGGTTLDETGVISTTTISAGSTSASTAYASATLSNVPYRFAGYVQITEATAGTWASAPTKVQGAGGISIASLTAFGMGQTWQDVTASRAIGTTYKNDTGRPIGISVIFVQNAVSSGLSLTVGGQIVDYNLSQVGSNGNSTIGRGIIIPPGATYSVANVGTASTLSFWKELR